MNNLTLLLAAAQPAARSTLTAIDWLAIALYFGLLLCVAWWVVKRGKDTAADYFLAGRNLGWWVIGASIFASNIGSEHIVGLAGTGAKDGVAMAHYELHAWCLLVLAWVFVPFYARSLVFTMPEFLERRFSTSSRYVLSVVSLITFIVSKIAVGIFAGGIVFGTLLPDLFLFFGTPAPFSASEIKEPAALVQRMQKGSDPVGAFLWSQTSAQARQTLGDPQTPLERQRTLLAEELNQVLKQEGLANPDRFRGVKLRSKAQALAAQSARSPAETEQLNRLLLEDACPKEVAKTCFEIDSFWIGSVLVIALTGLYTALGGMRAVAYNDAVQVVVLIVGSALLTIYGLVKLGGWTELRNLCGSDMFNLWKPMVPIGVESTWAPVWDKNAAGETIRQAWYFNDKFPWLGMAICAPVIGSWYWCTDQYIVQRALGAPNEQVARRGSIFASFLKLFPPYLFIVPGMICFALVKSGKVPALTAAFAADPNASQGAFPLMVQHLLPAGLRGIVVAGLLSALMGSLAGVFNACSTLFTVDIYEKLRPKASQHELVRVGRIATTIMVIIAMAWIPVVKGATGLYGYLQAVQGYLAPPIFVVFFFGVFWKRLNAQGCLWAMIVGFVIGLFRMLVDTPVTLKLAGYENGYTPDSFLWIINNIFFQYFSILITVISAIVMVGVSYMTREPDYDKIKNLSFGTVTDEHRAQSAASWDWRDVLASAFVLGVILAGYLYFRG
jgi:solute:Na+ symporter, SSS family